jgi:hypothetical protein
MILNDMDAKRIVRERDGGVQIKTMKGWTDLPARARTLVETAQLFGWKVESDGTRIRTNSDGDLIVAVVLSRPEGPNRRGGQSPAFTIRVPWVCEAAAFRIGKILFRSSLHGWRELESLKGATEIVIDHALY